MGENKIKQTNVPPRAIRMLKLSEYNGQHRVGAQEITVITITNVT